MVKSLHFPCRGRGVHPWSERKTQDAAQGAAKHLKKKKKKHSRNNNQMELYTNKSHFVQGVLCKTAKYHLAAYLQVANVILIM